MDSSFQRFARSPQVRVWAWIALSALLLYLALRGVNLNDIWDTLSHADFRFIGLAIFSVALNILFKVARWHVLVEPSKKGVGFGKLTMSLMTGQTLNWFLPARVGDVSRAYVIGGLGPGRSFVLGTVGVEKVLDMFSYVLLFLIALLLVPLPSWLNNSGYMFAAITLTLIVGVIVLVSFPEWFLKLTERLMFWVPVSYRLKIISWLTKSLSSLEILSKGSGLFKVAFLSAIVWGTAIWTNHLTALALGLELPITAALVVLVVLQIGIILPGSPGRIGVFQYLCIIALAIFGIEQAVGFSYGVLLQAIVLIPATLVSLFFFGFLGLGPKTINILEESKRNQIENP